MITSYPHYADIFSIIGAQSDYHIITLLSGGEAQKVAIARAYMGERDILIFDEPSAALDPIAERELFERIRQENQGKTVIMISHRVAFA